MLAFIYWKLSSTPASFGSITNALPTPNATRCTREQPMEKSYAVPGSSIRIPRSTSRHSTSLGSRFWSSS
nr:unnamed protein product [Digitaria exilis]